jgi:PKD repeat protein
VQLCEPPVASFAYEPSYLLFHYNNANTVADSLRWFFGDGTTSTQNNPEHLFASAGNYTTSLVAYNSCATDTFNVSFFACDSMASSFTFTTNGNLVSFTSTSYNYYDVFWDFGDGNTSTELNPTHEYATGGSYIVSHYSINACDSVVSTEVVDICELPISQFSADYVGDMTFAFNNLSSNYTSCIWYFGDGDSSLVVNPTHTYDSCLAYPVTLVVTNECGTATFIDTINLLTDLFEKTKDPFITLSPSASGNIEVFTREQAQNHELYMFNVRGELIYQARFNNSLTIPSKNYKDGIYIVKILNTASQTVYVKKIQLVR